MTERNPHILCFRTVTIILIAIFFTFIFLYKVSFGTKEGYFILLNDCCSRFKAMHFNWLQNLDIQISLVLSRNKLFFKVLKPILFPTICLFCAKWFRRKYIFSKLISAISWWLSCVNIHLSANNFMNCILDLNIRSNILKVLFILIL